MHFDPLLAMLTNRTLSLLSLDLLRISIGSRMNLLVHLVIYGHEWYFESSQNTTSDNKSRNARAGAYVFSFVIFSTKLFHRATLHALRTTQNAPMVAKFLNVLFEPINNIMLWQANQGWSFGKFLRKYNKLNSKAKFQLKKRQEYLRFPTVPIATFRTALCDLFMH